MGRYDLKHIDRGISYIPIDNNMSNKDIDNLIEENKGHTIVLFRNGKYDMKNVLKELIKTTLNT